MRKWVIIINMKKLNNSQFELLKDIFEQITINYDENQEEKRQELFDSWPEIIGQKIAKVSKLYEISADNVLTIACADSFVTNELFMEKQRTLDEVGEFGLIDILTKNFSTTKSTIKGIGDDCAVLEYSVDEYQLVTTDFLMEGIHFDLVYTPLKHIGYKAVVAGISDIYAMNGTPKQITASIAVSAKFSVNALEQLYDGIRTACGIYGVELIGGDTSASMTGLAINITAMGTVAKDKITLEALRGIKKEFLEAKTAKGSNGELPDEQALRILQKMIKQRKESAEMYTSANRPELAQAELEQAAVIEKYLPKQMSEEELTIVLKDIIAQVGAHGPQDMGKVMGTATKQLAGKAEGKAISTKVKELLNS